MASTKAAPHRPGPEMAPRFRLYVTLDNGQHFEPFASRTAVEAQAFAADCVISGWWHEGIWYPPHRLSAIRTEPLP